MALIIIEGMEFHAKHGCFEEEQRIGTLFLVDVRLKYNASKPEKTDEITDALDYQKIYETVKKEMDITSKLLEHLTRRIVDKISDSFSTIEMVQVKVTKQNPSLGKGIKVGSVSVAISRQG
jgi:7,8-dihydroneopterin aldolase/epimerase/oxygenase